MQNRLQNIKAVLTSAALGLGLGLGLAGPINADVIATIDDQPIGGKATLAPDTGQLTVTDEQGKTRSIPLADLDEVRFGEDLVVVKGGDLLLIRNDRAQTMNRQTGSIKLRAGLHRFVVPYWQGEQQFGLSLTVSGPGIEGEVELGADHLRCFRDADEAVDASPGIDTEGYRLPEIGVKDANDRRRFISRSRYRFYTGDDSMPFKNVGVIRQLTLKRPGTTTAINTGMVTEPNQYIGIVFEAFFFAQQDGEYNFALTSDDGSQLYFGTAEHFQADELGSVSSGPTPWRIELAQAGTARGELVGIQDGKASTKLTMGDETPQDASIPLSQIRSIWDTRIDLESIDRDKEPADQDTVYFRDKDKPEQIITVNGTIIGMTQDNLTFTFRDKERNLTRDRVVGMVFKDAQRPKPDSPGFYQVLSFRTGQVLPCKIVELDAERVKLELLDGGVVTAPRNALITMRCENGRRIDLTRISPTATEAVPYFNLAIPHRVNESFEGGPIRLYDEQTYERGLAVHSRSRLHYKLDRPCQRFRASFGLMEPEGRLGNVTARVLGDGKVLWEQADITFESGVIAVDVELAGVQRLVLEVDFGQGQNVGDRAAWCNPELIYADVQ